PVVRRAAPTTRPATAAAAAALAAIVVAVLPVRARPAGAQAAPIPGGRHVLVILLDRAGPPVIASSASIQGVAARGAAGLMSTATADAPGGDAPLAPVVTLSAGAPAVGPAAEPADDGGRTF